MIRQNSSSVAIIIAAYNAEGTIGRAIASALAEPEVTQVIVVDDHSSDATLAIARSMQDETGRLIVIAQPFNGGPSLARNCAIEITDADWISPLDADDFFISGRIAKMLEYEQDVDIIADDMWQVDENDVDGERRPLMDVAMHAPIRIDFYDFVSSNITRRGRERGELGFIKPLIRRSLLVQHHVLYKEHMRLGEDFELYSRLLGLGARMIMVPYRGYVSVIRDNSLSGQHSEHDLKHLRDADMALRGSLNLTQKEVGALMAHYKSVNCRLQWRLLIAAVKKRNLRDSLKCFTHSPHACLYLLRQLLHQAYVRTTKSVFP